MRYGGRSTNQGSTTGESRDISQTNVSLRKLGSWKARDGGNKEKFFT